MRELLFTTLDCVRLAKRLFFLMRIKVYTVEVLRVPDRMVLALQRLRNVPKRFSEDSRKLMEALWFHDDSNVVQHVPNMVPTWFQHGSNVVQRGAIGFLGSDGPLERCDHF